MKGSEPMDNTTIGAILRHERRELDLTLKKLAEKTGLKQSHISAIEHNRISPSLKAFLKIIVALEIEDINWTIRIFKEDLNHE